MKSCRACLIAAQCGGLDAAAEEFDFGCAARGTPDRAGDVVCMGNPDRFVAAGLEIGRWDYLPESELCGVREVLPAYIPCIKNGSCRSGKLVVPDGVARYSAGIHRAARVARRISRCAPPGEVPPCPGNPHRGGVGGQRPLP